jgi:hypothetical protein
MALPDKLCRRMVGKQRDDSLCGCASSRIGRGAAVRQCGAAFIESSKPALSMSG